MTRPWYEEAVFYHIYPLGFCGAPERNDHRTAPMERLNKIGDWIAHLQSLGVTAVYLGPVFESGTHGYDTVDLTQVDRRLGTSDTLRRLIDQMHAAGMRVVLDGVFHHVGRSFFAFEDVRRRRQSSPYREWIAGLDFKRRNSRGDPFQYDGWEGHTDLVRLNLGCAAVVEYIFDAVAKWVRDFDIDGIRLDVAYLLGEAFLRRLSEHCRGLKEEFWLMGEVIHGDYGKLLGPDLLHSVTNYECYKGLYSCHNDGNYFEIAHSLDRQFGKSGLYTEHHLYNFADNHDVDRVRSALNDPRHLNPLYALLFTMPGIPSIYYGSEWGVEGRKGAEDDRALRPSLSLEAMVEGSGASLAAHIGRLARARRASTALTHGRYESLFVASRQFAFKREQEDELVVVAVNAASRPETVEIQVGGQAAGLQEFVNGDDVLVVKGGAASIEVAPHSCRILRGL